MADRRAAQRATARAVREYRQTGAYASRLPSATPRAARAGRTEYLDRMVDNPSQRPPKDSPEGKSLGRAAGLARWNKGDPRYLVFKDYWYKDKK